MESMTAERPAKLELLLAGAGVADKHSQPTWIGQRPDSRVLAVDDCVLMVHCSKVEPRLGLARRVRGAT